MRIVHSVLNENEKNEARMLGEQLRSGDQDALMKLELRLLRATKDNEHFTEWFSEVVQQIMTDEVRAKLRAELAASEAVNARLRSEDSR